MRSRDALSAIDGLDADAIVAAIDSDEVQAAYKADCREARSAAGTPTEAQGRSSNRGGGGERYTAPSIIFEQDGTQFEVGGLPAARGLRHGARQPRQVARPARPARGSGRAARRL